MKKHNNKINRRIFCFVTTVMITCSFLLVGCGQTNKNIEVIKTIEDLAYDNNSKADYIVYLEENNVYEPYLVLTSDYGGNVLLLRKKLMADTRPYKENESGWWASHDYGSYYEDSSIDNYLNTEFYDTLSQSVRDAIVNSDIVITDKGSYMGPDRISITILRKVFLLSLAELAFEGVVQYISVQEGNPLKYFEDDYTRRVADLPDGSKCAYWTRTPELWETYRVFTMANGAGTGAADISSGVRPAFCVKKTTPVIQNTDVVEGQTVFIIK